MEIDVNNPEHIQAIQAAGFVAKTDVDSLIKDANKSLESNRDDILNQLREQKEKYQGVDLDVWTKLSGDARFNKIATDGFDGYERDLGGELQERLRAAQSDAMMKEQEYLRTKEDLEGKVSQYDQALKNSELKRKLGMTLMQNDKVNTMAIQEIERDALNELSLDDKGNIIVLGEEGIPRQTAEGPMNEKDWLNDMMKIKPYRFLGASGGGINQNQGLAGVDLDKLTPAEKIALGRRQRG